MKKQLQVLCLGLVLSLAPQLMKSQIVITSPTEDGYVSDATAITTNNPYLWGKMKIGSSAVDGTPNVTSAIIPFQLPAVPEGKKIESASLKVYVSFGRQWLNSNVDLYGLSFVAENDEGTGRALKTSDHFTGAFGDGNGNDTGIEDDYFTKNVPLGTLDVARWEETSETGNAALVNYIKAQYDAGAKEGDWVFLRLSIDNPDMTGSQYFEVPGGDDADFPPTLTITLADDGSTGILEEASSQFSVFPNPVVNNEVTIVTEDMNMKSDVCFYNLSGQLAKKMVLNTTSDNIHLSNLNLEEGIYLVKLNGESGSKIQKITIR